MNEKLALRVALGLTYSNGEMLYVNGEMLTVAYSDGKATLSGKQISWTDLEAVLAGAGLKFSSTAEFIRWCYNPINRVIWRACPCDAPPVDLRKVARTIRATLGQTEGSSWTLDLAANRTSPVRWTRRVVQGEPAVLAGVGRYTPVVITTGDLAEFAAPLV